ncbi:LOW QUALITY PROTEIN: uncharacterized protein LOC120260915 [Dioscorea cayenensis subsp. rotundata]|uniref:LOW QUALITY PROTEIN: uncharacterized protein LOC120260915 n=1 Tax=Dioscorea cayennensis subsp. rotundata TaxID=55577 RepID=A0AB40BAW7_DIOCR|nr:LOW QUALITY PROTEIN: uncharacterized protein LOC120260915 [Dioscorea cayenensis subsp. rotundata]
MPREESLIGTCYFDPEVDMTLKDAKDLWSVLWHQEELVHKKRRWLMGFPSTPMSEDARKRVKRPKFLATKFLPESLVRRDEVSFETVKTKIEKSFGSFTQGKYHVVQDYLAHFDKHQMRTYVENTAQFFKTFYSIMDDLNNTALLVIANTVTSSKVSFDRTRQQMKKIIKEYLPKTIAESDLCGRIALLNTLSQIFQKPDNFREKQLTLCTPFCESLQKSIQNLLDRLHEMPIQTLLAMNRKLKGIKAAPQFPPTVSISCKKELFKDRIRKRCDQMMSKLKKGMDLPKPLAKALSVMLLFLKYESGCTDIMISEFFPFIPKTMELQNDILRALWSLQKVKHSELKALQSLIDPKAEIPWKTFRTTLTKYLMEYLFECDETELSVEAHGILIMINRRSRRQACLISKEAKEDEIECVLNVSCQLKQFFLDILPETATHEDSAEEMESDDQSGNNDFVLSDRDYYSYNDELNHQHVCDSITNNELEATGESFSRRTSNMDQGAATDSQKNINQTNLDQDADTNVVIASSKLVEHGQNTYQLIQDICDETSLLYHKVIGHWLDKIMQLEGRQTDAITRSYLRGEPSHPVDLRGSDTEDHFCAPNGDKGPLILFQVVEELLPNFPMSSLQRLKDSMGLS